MKVIGLFAGIGGFELGLHKCGFQTELFCEIMNEAQLVLKKHFPNVPIHSDINTLKAIPKVDLISAGFPCQDLSIAGKKDGIAGLNSSLVSELFRLIRNAKKNSPNHIAIENVPYLLSLNGGEAIKYITETLSSLGYNWAYRIIDPRGFGIPQRRPRFILIASKILHPREVLFNQNEAVSNQISDKLVIKEEIDYGFYWTEGRIGIGWAKNSVPPIKGGSGLGIPSPPAIWFPEKHFFGTPSIEDAERLQGFPENWTSEIENHNIKRSIRWKLIGNAVNTQVSEWIGNKIISNNLSGPAQENIIYQFTNNKWSSAAYNDGKRVYGVKASLFPEYSPLIPISNFMKFPLKPLSFKATSGFYKRVKASTLIKYPREFIVSLETYMNNYVE